MKNYTHIPLLIVLLISLNSHSQNFAPIGATWYYGLVSQSTPDINYSKWEAINDSLILGKSTSKIQRTDGYAGTIDTVMYVYEDSGVVYKYLAITNSFDTLYNFNANANDFWSLDVDTNCSLTVTVDSTSMITINSFNLKVLYVTTTNGEFSGTIIEKIGHQRAPLPGIGYLCYGLFDGDSYDGLRCYADTVIGSYFTGIVATCDTITGIYDYNMDNMVNVYPNPASTLITIELPLPKCEIKTQLQLFDVTGKKVLTKQINTITTPIDISNYPKGMYFYQLLGEKENYSGKLIIQ